MTSDDDDDDDRGASAMSCLPTAGPSEVAGRGPRRHLMCEQ